MSTFSKRFLSVLLALTMLITAGSAIAADAATGNIGVTALDGVLTGLLSGINAIVPDNKKFTPISERVNSQFYSGTESFLDAPAANAAWNLGYSQVSLVPDDWETKDYYLGGYIMLENGFSNNVEEIVDDMRARVIAIDDGSGRGISIFATIDCIGMTNADIRSIRECLEKLETGADINAITVSSTHCHSCIDTEGLWTNLLPKAFGNLFKSYFMRDKLETGVDSEYMEFLCNATAGAMKQALSNMTSGTLSFAKKDIGDGYFNNKNRSSASALMTDMTRLVFTPFNTAVKPTMIVNVAAHPDVAGLPTSDGQSTGRQLSGDYVYYMGETIEGGGYNFMFFNGAIAGIYMGRGPSNDGVSFNQRYEQSARYGDELGKIALSLTKTYEEISNDAYITDWDEINADKEESGDSYSLWFEDWTPVTETALRPLMNIVFREVKVEITNPLMKLAGKLNLANYDVYKEGRKYFVFVEIGYMEIDNLSIVLMPGEVCQDLVDGGSSLTADGSYSGKAFPCKSIDELFGADTICFGLANDAIGYVIPDNDYSMAIVDDHYQELISLGQGTASALMTGYAEIYNDFVA